MCRDLFGAQVARISLLIQELLVQDLKVNGARPQGGRNQGKEHQYQCRPADEAPRRLGFCFCAASHGRSMTRVMDVL
jgi:hypothetical protein